MRRVRIPQGFDSSIRERRARELYLNRGQSRSGRLCSLRNRGVSSSFIAKGYREITPKSHSNLLVLSDAVVAVSVDWDWNDCFVDRSCDVIDGPGAVSSDSGKGGSGLSNLTVFCLRSGVFATFLSPPTNR
jgi:hypothetical protein